VIKNVFLWLNGCMLSDLARQRFLALMQDPGIKAHDFWRFFSKEGGVSRRRQLPVSWQGAWQDPQAHLPDSLHAWQQNAHHHLVYYGHLGYPEALLALENAPPLLYYQGELAALATPLLAIVGSRAASAPGRDFAFWLAQRMVGLGWGVVSGLAFGVDIAAHQGALAAGGVTVAVVPGSLQPIYPKSHRAFVQPIMVQGGVLSECPLGAPVYRAHFYQRNRLISGLARAVLVVEADKRSGSLITARHALLQGRDVMAYPGTPGCDQLIRQGAALVTDLGHILETLGIQGDSGLPDQVGGACRQMHSLSVAQRALLAYIPRAWLGLGVLVQKVAQPLDSVLSMLTELEIKGLVESSCAGVRRMQPGSLERRGFARDCAAGSRRSHGNVNDR
jgi:DNA processing protein